MRKYLFIVLLLFSCKMYSQNYYVSPRGNDANDGSDTSSNKAWLTLQKAILTAQAGSTVYFLDGAYTPTTYTHGSDIFHYDPVNDEGYSGTAEARIIYRNYPNATPIFDLSTPTPAGASNIGLYMVGVSYVSFYGLTFQGLKQVATSGPGVNTIEMVACSNLYFERVVLRDNGGAGFRYFGGMGDMQDDYGVTVTTDTSIWINCDAIRNIDVGGNYGDGWKLDQDAGAYFLIKGCRALYNADDGFDVSGSATRVAVNNIAFGNGYVPNGNGNGFKFAGPRDTLDYSTIIFVNNLSAYNHTTNTDGAGFGFPDYQVSDTSYRRANARVYNNTSYKNDIGYIEFTNPLWKFRNTVYRNNIGYQSQKVQDDNNIDVQVLQYYYPESHNTWDRVTGGYSFEQTDTVTVTDADFVLVDSTLAAAELLADRSSNGALPPITFMKLAEGSDLIEAGTTYGFSEISSLSGVPDIGLSPNIGTFEYNDTNTTPSVFTSAVSSIKSIHATVGGNITSDGGRDITQRGIVWGTSANPTTSNNVITVSGTTGAYTTTLTGLTSTTTYHVRSYATNSAGTSYGANISFTTPAYTQVGSGGKILFYNGKQIIIK